MTGPAPLKVLCVDDHPDAAESTAAMLSAHGLDALACVSGEEALATAAAVRPDACLVDLRMPGMDGCELARRLRSLFGGDVVLVAVTGEKDPDRDRHAIEAGFDWLFEKPADVRQLLAVLTRPGDAPRGR